MMTKEVEESNIFRESIKQSCELYGSLYKATLHNLDRMDQLDASQKSDTPEYSEAQRLARVNANGLMLLLYCDIVQFLVRAEIIERKHKPEALDAERAKRGPKVKGTATLGQSVVMLANLARHFHQHAEEPKARPRIKPFGVNMNVLKILGLDEAGQHDHAASQFLRNLPKYNSRYNSYEAFQADLLEISA